MKNLIIFTLSSAVTLGMLHAGPFNKGGAGPRGGGKIVSTEKKAEKIAMEEEALLDRHDTHSLKTLEKDPEASDKRSESTAAYHKHTLKRIVRLATLGSLSKAESDAFKKRHSEITISANASEENLTEEESKAVRSALNNINDDINDALTEADKGKRRTPFVNRALHRFEERLEFGERSERLSSGEASGIRRAIGRLTEDVEQAKAKDLDLKTREKLIEDALEIERKLKEELGD